MRWRAPAHQIEVVAQNDQLTFSGSKAEDSEGGRYLQRGIATRAFERRFQLADVVEICSADLDNDLLRISLKREISGPMTPRRIAIGSAAPANDRLEGWRFEQKQPEGDGPPPGRRASAVAGQRALVRIAATSAIRSTSR